ncbi:MAG: SLC13 family permease [Proteobacteria bacterium]|nr:SLC13 family permease [Pseudomonadota bacterium]
MKLHKKVSLFLFLLMLFTAVEKIALFQTLFSLNHAQAIALSVLLVAALLWVTEWVPLFVTSLIIVFLQIGWLLPVMNPAAGKLERQAFLSPFFSDIILLFMGGFILASMLHKYHLDDRIARWLLQKTGTRPGRLLFGIMAVAALLSMWMSNTATTAMMFAIVLPIIACIPETNKFSKGLALSIPFACNLGGLGTPIGTPPNAIAMSFLAEKGVLISFGGWMLAAIPLMLVLLIICWFILLKLYPPGDLKIHFPEIESKGLTGIHWLVSALFLLTIIGWLTTDLHGLSIGTISLVPAISAFGLGLLNVKDFKNLPWDVLFMVGGGICLGVGLKSSGLTQKIVETIPLEFGFIWVLVAFLLLAAVMTTFMSNTATANLLIPIAISLEFKVALFVIPIAMICSTAMALPISTPPNAIAFGSGMLESRDMIKPGALVTVVSLMTILLMGLFFLPLLRL